MQLIKHLCSILQDNASQATIISGPPGAGKDVWTKEFLKVVTDHMWKTQRIRSTVIEKTCSFNDSPLSDVMTALKKQTKIQTIDSY